MNSIKTVWFWWWGWNPAHMENMLEKMEASGWKLFQVDYNGLRFKFIRGQEETVRYSVDYQPKASEDYLSIFDEDGWKLKWSSADWYLWRKPYTTERPEIFSETSSLIERNNRLIKLLSPLFYMLIIIFVMLLLISREKFQVLIRFYVVIIALYTFMLSQLRKHNRKLKNEIRE